MPKIVCFKTKCADGKNYVGCALRGLSWKRAQYCEPPEIVSRDIDLVEIASPKGKIKTQFRTNEQDILDIEIR